MTWEGAPKANRHSITVTVGSTTGRGWVLSAGGAANTKEKRGSTAVDAVQRRESAEGAEGAG